MPAELIYPIAGALDRSPRATLRVIDADVTNLAVEGVVSNDDVDGRMYTVIASSIKATAGPGVEQESVSRGPFRLGEAWSTDAGGLPPPYRRIIHVASMDRSGRTSLPILRKCVLSGLDEARKLGLGSVGIAAFGTGPGASALGAIDLTEWLAEIGPEIADYIAGMPDDPDSPGLHVILALYVSDSTEHIALIKQAIARWSVSK